MGTQRFDGGAVVFRPLGVKVAKHHPGGAEDRAFKSGVCLSVRVKLLKCVCVGIPRPSGGRRCLALLGGIRLGKSLGYNPPPGCKQKEGARPPVQVGLCSGGGGFMHFRERGGWVHSSGSPGR